MHHYEWDFLASCSLTTATTKISPQKKVMSQRSVLPLPPTGLGNISDYVASLSFPVFVTFLDSYSKVFLLAVNSTWRLHIFWRRGWGGYCYYVYVHVLRAIQGRGAYCRRSPLTKWGKILNGPLLENLCARGGEMWCGVRCHFHKLLKGRRDGTGRRRERRIFGDSSLTPPTFSRRSMPAAQRQKKAFSKKAFFNFLKSY